MIRITESSAVLIGPGHTRPPIGLYLTGCAVAPARPYDTLIVYEVPSI